MLNPKKICFICMIISCACVSMSAQINGYYGILNARKISVKSFNNQTYSITTADAIFSYEAKTHINIVDGKFAGNVRFNNHPIDFIPLQNPPNNEHFGYYIDNSNSLNFSDQEWSISGHGQNISNFTFQNQTAFPSVNFSLSFPDTIRKSDSIVVFFENVLNADSIALYINDNNGQNSNKLMVFTTASAPAFYLTPEELTVLSTTSDARISFEAINYTTVNVDGKRFSFRNHCEVIRPKIVIIN